MTRIINLHKDHYNPTQNILLQEILLRRVKWVFSRGGCQWDRGGHKERVNEGEYGGCILYSYMKIE
jgi:hypothetical protein